MAIERETRRRRVEFQKRKCKICEDQVQIDYKQPDMLRRFLTERGKIVSRRLSGTCARHQRAVTRAIKLARGMMLIK